MCGIIGYSGISNVKEILLNGLTNLEYRGYDSSGISIIQENTIQTYKAIGKLENLKKTLSSIDIKSHIGIGHTRWATHGESNLENAHPHVSTKNNISLVHNGIIENYLEIKQELLNKNISFYGKTDTEVIVKYLESIYSGDPLDSLFKLNKKLKGSYALAIIFEDFNDRIYFLKKDSPLIIGLKYNHSFLSSDYTSISEFASEIVYLKNNQYGFISKDDIKIYQDQNEVNYSIEIVEDNCSFSNKNNYSTFLEKEIFESSSCINNILSRYIRNEDIDFSSHYINAFLDKIKYINIIGCGSSYHVGLIGKYMFEKFSKINTNVYIGSEYPNTCFLKNTNTLNIFISQSGETADLISCIPLTESFKLGIINTKNSSIALEMDDNFYLECGKEVSVATTKAYLCQLAFIYLLSIKLGIVNKHISIEEKNNLLNEFLLIPNKINKILAGHQAIVNLANNLKDYKNVFFIGRGLDYLTCIEGSLKLKEITYIHSEAISSGELKHGTISLIDENVYTISLLATSLKDKTLSNIEEIKARNGKVFTISTHSSNFNIPETYEVFYPFLLIVPLQLLSLYTGQKKNLDIDKPRNLAKSVTVL